jgi:hypothetical protein
MLSTPIAYIIFNRPRHTRETFAAIREQRPAKLFIIADGPRLGHPTDADRCREVREIVEEIDWPCEVQRNYAEQNLGCKMRPKTGIDWVFEYVERAIILEDDCLPHPDFYDYCEELLERYKNDNRVMVVTGNNFQDGRRFGDAAYYFSKNNHVWGWATWRRAWLKNDSSIKFWPEFKNSQKWLDFFYDSTERKYWESIFNKVYAGEFETAWDYPWTASVWYHGGLTATPNVNLVTNIGFGPDGTHTVAEHDQEGLPVQPLGKLTHPEKIVQDRKADRYVFDYKFGGINQRLRTKLLKLPRRIVGKLLRIMGACN